MASFPTVTLERYVKDKDARLDFGWNYAATVNKRGATIVPYLQEDETITASVWIIEEITDDAAPLDTDDDSFDDTTTTIWLLDGTVGSIYTVTNRITTSDGRIDDRSFEVKIVER